MLRLYDEAGWKHFKKFEWFRVPRSTFKVVKANQLKLIAVYL